MSLRLGSFLRSFFEVTLTGIRNWLFAHTSSKIDVELGAWLFRHLLGLPLTYFQSRRVGDSVARTTATHNGQRLRSGIPEVAGSRRSV
ncbi:ABC transporter transmembrane domain-containing protein [Paraburkholderia atlantica]|uniref:ABC transporter transmembrane domain-containing protein n=1 Tax=Paraburkholderia atlantica TaxID=2654982 RepID=UPI00288BD9D1|nr:ABC transporter transmembrane domain-containing protein [Paraburkholderia atlantica]